jgi:hypothetical protein
MGFCRFFISLASLEGDESGAGRLNIDFLI